MKSKKPSHNKAPYNKPNNERIIWLSPLLLQTQVLRVVSYASLPVQKQHPRGETTSEPYKPAFHSGHLSHNTSHGGAATLQVFRLP